jgi:K+/H+ antiporter YhaU regulatory subunit KhtT
MGKEVRVVDLPGIGTKYDLGGEHGHRLAVIAHRDGRKELYAFERGAEDPTAVITLSDKQARMLGAVLTGTYFSDE